MPIKIYTDESVPVAVAAGLRRRGVDARSARDVGNLGLTDVEQLRFALTSHYLLFTHDTDFLALAANLVAGGESHWGLVYAHQEKLGIGGCIRRLKEIVDVFEPEEMRDHVEFL